MGKRGLCIGINDYPGTASDLRGCVNDALDWSAALERRGFTVRRLFDRQATLKALRQAIDDLVVGARRGDSLVVQFSGHGSFVPDRDGDEPDRTDECLCPYDVVRNGPLTDDELSRRCGARAEGVRLVVISDSCHSGSVTRFSPISTPPTIKGRHAPRRTVRFLPPANFLARTDVRRLQTSQAQPKASSPRGSAALLFAGCQDVEYSYDASFQGRANGAFTFVALRELARLGPDADYRAWYAAVRLVLPSAQYPQTPNLFGAASTKRWKVLT